MEQLANTKSAAMWPLDRVCICVCMIIVMLTLLMAGWSHALNVAKEVDRSRCQLAWALVWASHIVLDR